MHEPAPLGHLTGPVSGTRDFYHRMLLIRMFEEDVLERFGRGELRGTTHACIGQEASAVAVCSQLKEQDTVVSNHRCHGHFLARTDRPDLLLAEMRGLSGGVCGGRGGSQHLCYKGFYSNGILGGTSPVAAGLALAHAQKKDGGISVVFHGDGAMGQGVIYETMNLAALWNLPLLFVLECNGYAQSTPTARQLAGDFQRRAEGFGLQAAFLEDKDPEALLAPVGAAIESVREGKGPRMLVIDTYRFCSHSKNDDCRDPREIDARREHDPLQRIANRLSAEEREDCAREATARLAQAAAFCETLAQPDPGCLRAAGGA